MSTAQRNDACPISVGPEQADVLRHQTLVVLEANHYVTRSAIAHLNAIIANAGRSELQ